MTRADDLGDNAALTPNDALGDVHAAVAHDQALYAFESGSGMYLEVTSGGHHTDYDKGMSAGFEAGWDAATKFMSGEN